MLLIDAITGTILEPTDIYVVDDFDTADMSDSEIGDYARDNGASIDFDRADLYIVAVGNAFDGMRMVGPFDDMYSAQEYAEGLNGEQWNIIPLDKPEV